MNKLLISIFDNETAASAGLHALRKLHNEGDITLYATGVIAKDAAGKLSVKQAVGQAPLGTGSAGRPAWPLVRPPAPSLARCATSGWRAWVWISSKKPAST
jgi:uncharacterized membrane protein